jgi:hypothetical protein
VPNIGASKARRDATRPWAEAEAEAPTDDAHDSARPLCCVPAVSAGCGCARETRGDPTASAYAVK